MSTPSPYNTPTSHVLPDARDIQAVKRPSSHGISWCTSGVKLFSQEWVLFLAIGFIFVLLSLISQIIPLIGWAISQLLTILLWAGFMYCCDNVEKQGHFSFNQFFVGFNQQTGPLLLLAAIYIAAIMLIFTIAGMFLMFTVGMDFIVAIQSPQGAPTMSEYRFLLLAMIALLIVMALTIPLLMAIWFAPTLIILDQKPFWDAVKLSFQGCLRNMLPFLVYGLVFLVIATVILLPLFASWYWLIAVFALYIIFTPIVFCTIYTSYKDIFVQLPDDVAVDKSRSPIESQ
ncbi:BPSS1780 family membrane protein [Zooshikella sp. RANM57]|uniref:BPSS1780 family membrane protein n=1 Tax=Zooshikella sp. RANM57 TaxID=3425863 RepID=UPI003D6DD6B5